MTADDDHRWMAMAVALSCRGLGQTYPNPNVGCVLVRGGRVVGRGWTQPGGRPHAEAMALAQSGEAAHGSTAYVTLEPCATPGRGPACAELLIAAGVTRVVAATGDPFPAVNGQGFATLRAAGVAVESGPCADSAQRAMAGFLYRQRLERAHVTLKLAVSLDGCIALADGTSRWITGERARAHAHLLRAQSDALLVGRGTYDADAPTLDVRLPGLEQRSPQRLLLTTATAPNGWTAVASPQDAARWPHANTVLVEGGAHAAAAFLQAGLVDRLILYRAPILIGAGRASLSDIGLGALADAHGRWHHIDRRMLGSDQLDIYDTADRD